MLSKLSIKDSMLEKEITDGDYDDDDSEWLNILYNGSFPQNYTVPVKLKDILPPQRDYFHYIWMSGRNNI